MKAAGKVTKKKAKAKKATKKKVTAKKITKKTSSKVQKKVSTKNQKPLKKNKPKKATKVNSRVVSKKADPTFRNNQVISVLNAEENNLKKLSVEIPKQTITVVTGLSGSGKSSLAFDTIYNESQRRFMDGLSSYSKNFVGMMSKPKVESIFGLSPSIAIDQRTVQGSPRSTVGTLTEVYDFLRLLYSRVGVPYCPEHNLEVKETSVDEAVNLLLKKYSNKKSMVMSPVAREKKGEFANEMVRWQSEGFLKARIDGEWRELGKKKKLRKTYKHNIDLLVDKIIIKPENSDRLKGDILRAWEFSGGQALFEIDEESLLFSKTQSCPMCGFSFPKLEPRHFSFNNPRGACDSCYGLGTHDIQESDEEKRVGVHGLYHTEVKKKYVIEDEDLKENMHKIQDCTACEGSRLNEQALSVKVSGYSLGDLVKLDLKSLKALFLKMKFTHRQKAVADKVLEQIFYRLDYLIEVGLGYLTINRSSSTLSGGESQRIRLATQLGSPLVGVLYVLDEPSIGLHPRDHRKLLDHLTLLKSRGNSLLVVEHDEETISEADYVIDIGPGAGHLGGELCAKGTIEEIKKNKKSLTGQYLSGDKFIPVPELRRTNEEVISLTGASGNNLKNVDIAFPLASLVGVSGVSGSGKSSLIMDTLYPAIAKEFYKIKKEPLSFETVDGYQGLKRILHVDQKPIGKTSRSVPATYIGVYQKIRELFASLPESQVRGFTQKHFSFNVKDGRCPECEGLGKKAISMSFLSDVKVLCPQCQGDRFNHEVLKVYYKDKNISDVLNMSVDESMEFFKNHKKLQQKLELLHKVGLGYLTLGQSSATLSGGESQRVKLSKELNSNSKMKTLYILDEPTTGLHFEDVALLVKLLHHLVEQGNTVVVIEHHLDVLKNCDYLIDMGPEGGAPGGDVVYQGVPEGLKKAKKSLTGPYLVKKLNK